MADAKGQTMLAIERKTKFCKNSAPNSAFWSASLLPTIRSRRKPSAATSTSSKKRATPPKPTAAPSSATVRKPTCPTPSAARRTSNSKPDCRPRLPDGRRWGPSDDRRQLDGAVLRKEAARQENLTIITNSVELVVELASNVETWSILLTGGRLKAESLALVGSQCEKISRQLSCGQGLRLLQGSRPRSGRH